MLPSEVLAELGRRQDLLASWLRRLTLAAMAIFVIVVVAQHQNAAAVANTSRATCRTGIVARTTEVQFFRAEEVYIEAVLAATSVHADVKRAATVRLAATRRVIAADTKLLDPAHGGARDCAKLFPGPPLIAL